MLLSDLLSYNDSIITSDTVFHIRRSSVFIAEGTRCDDVVRQYSDCIVRDFFFSPEAGSRSLYVLL